MNSIPFIFIHLGNEFFPDYVNIALKQCKKWNPNNNIYLICDNIFFPNVSLQDIILIDVNTISCSDIRGHFINNSKLDMKFRHGFWRYTTERLFVLYDFCMQNNITEFLHLENDNMVYFSADELQDTFRSVNGISSPALSKDENTFGIMYCNNLSIFMNFLIFLLSNNSGQNEMGLGSKFFFQNKDTCKFLPSIPSINENMPEEDTNIISDQIQQFGGVFDPAQYGQWLGGIDPRNGESAPFIFSNIAAIIQANRFEYDISKHTNGYMRYYIKYENTINYPIFLLHIHSKNLEKFYI